MGQGGGTYIYNLNGGTLTVPSITATTYGSNPQFNFNGGTLAATGATSNFISAAGNRCCRKARLMMKAHGSAAMAPAVTTLALIPIARKKER